MASYDVFFTKHKLPYRVVNNNALQRRIGASMKYIFYGLAALVILQALAVAYFFGLILEDMGAALVISFLYGAISGSVAGKLLVLGWEEK